MKHKWMLLVLAILLLFGPRGPLMAEGRTLNIDASAAADSRMNDRILLAALPGTVLAAGLACGRRRGDET
ncbi:MAG: hypothetical protein J5865_06690 [Lachnospiraceae bacterium]|nr:hypothetical protein [Lachnospiraceae bacterium]